MASLAPNMVLVPSRVLGTVASEELCAWFCFPASSTFLDLGIAEVLDRVRSSMRLWVRQFQIFKAIVCLIAVDMVNYFFGVQRPAELGFHEGSMPPPSSAVDVLDFVPVLCHPDGAISLINTWQAAGSPVPFVVRTAKSTGPGWLGAVLTEGGLCHTKQ